MEDKKESKRDTYGGDDAWKELFRYVKNDIMQLPNFCTIPREIVLKLDGLSKGVYISNKKIEPMATYQYKDILMAFKVAEILMRNKTDFKSSEHRFNYALSIVESKINDIVKARLSKEKVTEKVKEIDVSVHLNAKAEYKSKAEKRKTSNVLEELW